MMSESGDVVGASSFEKLIASLKKNKKNDSENHSTPAVKTEKKSRKGVPRPTIELPIANRDFEPPEDEPAEDEPSLLPEPVYQPNTDEDMFNSDSILAIEPEAPVDDEMEIAPEMMGLDSFALDQSVLSEGGRHQYKCTVCYDLLYPTEKHHIKQHPKLQVLLCKSCFDFYSNGEITKDDDGLDNQCSWCGQGGTLFLCDYCTSGFCKKCLRRNFKRDVVLCITGAKKWKCFNCDPKPLTKHIKKYLRLMEEVVELENKRVLAKQKQKASDVLKHRLMRDGARISTPVQQVTLARSHIRDSTEHSAVTATNPSLNGLMNVLMNTIKVTPCNINMTLLNKCIYSHDRVTEELSHIIKQYRDIEEKQLTGDVQSKQLNKLSGKFKNMIQLQILSYYSLLADKHDAPSTSGSDRRVQQTEAPLLPNNKQQLQNGSTSMNLDPEFIDISDLKVEARDRNERHNESKKSPASSRLAAKVPLSSEFVDLCSSDESDQEKSTAKHSTNLLSPRTFTRKHSDESPTAADLDTTFDIGEDSLPLFEISSQPAPTTTSNLNKTRPLADLLRKDIPMEHVALDQEATRVSGDELLEDGEVENITDLIPDSILDSDGDVKTKTKKSKSKKLGSIGSPASKTLTDTQTQELWPSAVNETVNEPMDDRSDTDNEEGVSQRGSAAGKSDNSQSEDESFHAASEPAANSQVKSPAKTDSRSNTPVITSKKASKKRAPKKDHETVKSSTLEKESQELEMDSEQLPPQSYHSDNESHKSKSRSSSSASDNKSIEREASDKENHVESDADARAAIGDLMSDDEELPISQRRGGKNKKTSKRRLDSSNSSDSSSDSSGSSSDSSGSGPSRSNSNMARKVRRKLENRETQQKQKEAEALRKLRENRERRQRRAGRRFKSLKIQRVKQLNRTERRYAMRRVQGLIVQLREKQQTSLQKLLTEIENKTKDELDPQQKLQQQCSVELTRYDLENPEVIQTLLTKHSASSSNTKSRSSPIKDSDSESDEELRALDKTIEKLSKFQIMIKKEDQERKRVNQHKRTRSKRSGTDSPPTKRSRRQISDSSELSDMGSTSESEEESSEESSNSDDIITLPNKEQIDNERALQNLLHDMSDSDDSRSDYSDLESSDHGDINSDSSVVPDKPKTRNKVKLKKRHKLEAKAIDSDDSQASSEEFEDEGMSDESSTESSNFDDGKKKDSDSDTSHKALATRHKKKKKKRNRVKSSSDTAQSDSDIQEVPEPSPSKASGRKSIRKVLKGNRLEKDTQKATKAETERRRRVEQKRKEYESLMADPSSPLKQSQKQKELVLERDDKGEPLVEVDQTLITRLKPHQLSAVQFLWDCCCETVKRTNETSGGGAILAHCMGLGKTLSLIAFVHTVLSYEDKLHLKKVLVVCPLGTVLNWKSEILHWTKHLDITFKVYEMSSVKKPGDRLARLKQWYNNGGICVIGYDLFSLLSRGARMKDEKTKARFKEYLQNPGADIVVADEGHILKSNKSQLRNAVCAIKTIRRIVLSGTPLQNRLDEYYYMMDFVKPRLLGSNNEFKNRFINPINNGSMKDSTPQDVRLMKKRAHVLHELLAGCVQRQDYTCLDKYLPPKHEYILKIPLSDLQIKLYRKYLVLIGADQEDVGRHGTLFADFQSLGRIWNHPMLMKTHLKREDDEDSFLDDHTSSSSDDPISDDILELNSGSENSNDKTWKPVQRKQKTTEKTVKDEPDKEEKQEDDGRTKNSSLPLDWWKEVVKGEDLNQIEISPKFSLLMRVLQDAYAVGDKVLLFSQSILNLDLIEDFLEQIDIESQKKGGDAKFRHKTGELGGWQKGKHYFRIDGSVEGKNRTKATKIFNTDNNFDARLFLISTRAGGVGINLVGANRVIIFDASWNPSNDLQAIFRAYRFGQNKPVYVYRFIAQGTMEEKIYNRQISKLSLSERVVDERQIERHYTSRNLQELYSFEPQVPGSQETPILPQDQLLADILSSTNQQLILSIQEHDSLLQHQMDENLTEEERQTAWREYNEERERGDQAANRAAALLENHKAETQAGIPPIPDIAAIYRQMKARYPNTVDSVLATMAREKFKHEQNRRILVLNQIQAENRRVALQGQQLDKLQMSAHDMMQQQQLYQQQQQQAYEEQFRQQMQQQRQQQQRQQHAQRYQQQMVRTNDNGNYAPYSRANQQQPYHHARPKPSTSSASVTNGLAATNRSGLHTAANQQRPIFRQPLPLGQQPRPLGQLSPKQQEIIARRNK